MSSTPSLRPEFTRLPRNRVSRVSLVMVLYLSMFGIGFAALQSGIGILFLDREAEAFDTHVQQVAAKEFPALSFSNSEDHAKIKATSAWVELANFPLPSESSFEYFSVGLEKGDRDRILAGKRTLFLNFTYPDNEAVAALHTISKFIDAIVRDLPTAVWDDENRQVLSTAEWKKKRVDSWSDDQIDISGHITMHAYRHPKLIRIVTLGLKKFRLPDLVLEETPSDLVRPAGNTINYLAQLLQENGLPKKQAFALDLNKIKHPAVRDAALSNPLKGATGKVTVALANSEPDSGDPDNRQFRLEFPDCEGVEPSERMSQAFSLLYGSSNEVLKARHDDTELLEARDRARKAFLAKKPLFHAGLKPNEHLSVKYGFTNGKTTEYMWLEVISWEGDNLSGVLTDDAYDIEGLKAGQKKTIPAAEIYDYLHYLPDGGEEGNETGKILEKREQK